jgi:hypothetical protein
MDRQAATLRGDDRTADRRAQAGAAPACDLVHQGRDLVEASAAPGAGVTALADLIGVAGTRFDDAT